MRYDRETALLFTDEGLPKRLLRKIEELDRQMKHARALITAKVYFYDGTSYGIYLLEKATDGELELKGLRIAAEYEKDVRPRYELAIAGARLTVTSTEHPQIDEFAFDINAVEPKKRKK